MKVYNHTEEQIRRIVSQLENNPHTDWVMTIPDADMGDCEETCDCSICENIRLINNDEWTFIEGTEYNIDLLNKSIDNIDEYISNIAEIGTTIPTLEDCIDKLEAQIMELQIEIRTYKGEL